MRAETETMLNKNMPVLHKMIKKIIRQKRINYIKSRKMKYQKNISVM